MPGYMEISVISRVGVLAGLPPGALPCLCLPVSRPRLCVTTIAPAGLPLVRWRPRVPARPPACPLARFRAPRSRLPAGLCLLVRRPAHGARALASAGVQKRQKYAL